MKKTLAVLLALVMVLVMVLPVFTSCNKQFLDTIYQFNWVKISLHNEVIFEGKIKSWTDFEDGDQIQVTVEVNGEIVTYLTHSSNVILSTRQIDE